MWNNKLMAMMLILMMLILLWWWCGWWWWKGGPTQIGPWQGGTSGERRESSRQMSECPPKNPPHLHHHHRYFSFIKTMQVRETAFKWQMKRTMKKVLLIVEYQSFPSKTHKWSFSASEGIGKVMIRPIKKFPKPGENSDGNSFINQENWGTH